MPTLIWLREQSTVISIVPPNTGTRLEGALKRFDLEEGLDFGPTMFSGIKNELKMGDLTGWGKLHSASHTLIRLAWETSSCHEFQVIRHCWWLQERWVLTSCS